MNHKAKVLMEILTDPWTYYFMLWIVLGAFIYFFEDKWRR